MSLLKTIQSGRENRPPRLMIYGGEGVGKAQPLDALVLTPTGFIPMADVRVGAEVIGRDGKAHDVLAVYPQGEKEVFRVTFRDGSSCECCDDHLWLTQTRHERDMGLPGAVRDLRSIRRTLRYGTHFNHAVPRVSPVEFAPSVELPIDPWLLGIYLAEGTSSHGACISNTESDIQNRVGRALCASDKAKSDARQTRISRRVPRNHTPSDFVKSLRDMGLCGKRSGEKFIPQPFLLASVDERLELLRGLCDGDGFVRAPGAIELCTASPRMAKDVMFLVRSLGGACATTVRPGKYTKNGVTHIVQDSHRISIVFTNGLVPVASMKQIGKWKQPEWMIRHTIRAVESIGRKACQCIVVDAPDSLYVTDDFIVTHNSTMGAHAPAPIFIQTEDGLGQIDCAKFPLAKSFGDVIAQLESVRDEAHEFQSLVIDSLDWLERLVWDEVCREFGVRSIEKADGGYGKGYTHALTQWRKVVSLLEQIRDKRNMVIILIAHAKVERFEDPENAAYDRYTPRLHKHACSLICEWVDAVLFATRRMRVDKDNGKASPVGADGGERVLRTNGSPACIAKNRYSLPSEIPLSWAGFIAGIKAQYGAKGATGEK